MRGRFQGVANIVRFNWPFYAMAAGAVAVLGILSLDLEIPARAFAWAALGIIVVLSATSLAVSWYVYDLSGFYRLEWLDGAAPRHIANINAGFDETSELLTIVFPDAELSVYDFYDPKRHTERSIERARAFYGQFPGTLPISTDGPGLEPGTVDTVLLIMAAHEIRDDTERANFFRQLGLALVRDGRIVVVEHVRDAANLIAYNIGAFHFHSLQTWTKTFSQAHLSIEKRVNINPFVTAFFLRRDGTTL